jgi:hypothetical protein
VSPQDILREKKGGQHAQLPFLMLRIVHHYKHYVLALAEHLAQEAPEIKITGATTINLCSAVFSLT